MPDYSLTRGEAADLYNAIHAGEKSDDYVQPCNIVPRDHIHAMRGGAVGSGLAGRVTIGIHEGGDMASVAIAAPEARQLAAELLNLADELDGIVYRPTMPDTTADLPEGTRLRSLDGDS